MVIMPRRGSIKRQCCLTSLCRVHPVGRRHVQPAGWMARIGWSGPARPAWLKAVAARFRCRHGRGISWRPPVYSLLVWLQCSTSEHKLHTNDWTSLCFSECSVIHWVAVITKPCNCIGKMLKKWPKTFSISAVYQYFRYCATKLLLLLLNYHYDILS